MKNIILLIPILINLLSAVDHCGTLTSDETWAASDEHLLTCQTFVPAGVTLTIEAGATVKSLADDGNGLAPALVVMQGGMLMAEGTAGAPITFTADMTDAELAANPRGNWGGVIINGYAPIATTGGVNYVEGLEGVPYGGSDPDDNSGVLSHVRVWHGGRSIGMDNEINGITLAGVGRGTTVEYSEVAYNLDDGFEMFGGTVDLHHCSVVNVGDDAFDTDEGYQGRGQFLFVHRDAESDKAHEMDSKTNSDFDSQPRSHPMFSNVTVMGGAEDALRLREGTGGDFRNYIIYDVGDDAIRNDDNGSELVTQDFSATAGLYPDYLYISSNTLMWNVGDQLFNDFEDTPSFAGTAIEADPGLSSAYMVVTPTAGGAAYQSVDAVAEAWFTQTDYKGAFGQDNWLEGLSILSGTFAQEPDCGSGDVNLDGSINVADIVIMVQYILGLVQFNDADICTADVNPDGVINVVDIVQTVQFILGPLAFEFEASYVNIIKGVESVSYDSDGLVGAVQFELTHDADFSIELAEDVMIADYITNDNKTLIIIVNPYSNKLFDIKGNYKISEVISANSETLIPTNVVIPDDFVLSNAYPNPFNPITTLNIQLSNESLVVAKVFNVNGQIVDIIHNGVKNAGSYNLTWDAVNFSSGIYFIETSIDSKTLIQKVSLIK